MRPVGNSMGKETLFAMPSSSILLLFSIALGLTDAFPWAEAEPTATYVQHEWSPRTTLIPEDPAKLFKRDSVGVETCGWVGGDESKPVTCGAGSSCIHDTAHALVGCCTTDGPCTNGVYSSCQDLNSQGWASSISIVNNGVLTCTSSAACYANTYPGPYVQWACGDATQGESLVTSYSGQPTDMRMQIVYTGVSFSAMPIQSTTSAASSTAASSTQAPGSSSTSNPTAAALGKVAPATSESAASSHAPVAKSNTAAVAGGSVAAAVGVALIAGAIFWLCRRRSRMAKNRRVGSFMARPKGGPPEPLQGRSFSSQPFQPIRPYSPEDWVSPMTGHPANAQNQRSIFPEPLTMLDDTSYHGAGDLGDLGALVNIDIDDSSSHHSSQHSPRSLSHPFDDPTPRAPQNPSFENLYDDTPPVPSPPHPTEYSPPPPSQFPQFSPPRPQSHPTFPPNALDREQGMPLHTTSEIDEFASNWHDAVVAQQVQESLERAARIHDRDTHIHEGELPDMAMGLGVAAAVPMRKAVPTRKASASDQGQGRVVDREARSEALREMGRSENVRMEGWSPRRLQTVRAYAESVASGRSTPSVNEHRSASRTSGNEYRSNSRTSGSIRAGSIRSDNSSEKSSTIRAAISRTASVKTGSVKEVNIPPPPKSPLRPENLSPLRVETVNPPDRMSFGLNNTISNAVGMSPGGSRQRYQLLDGVIGDNELPIMHAPEPAAAAHYMVPTPRKNTLELE